MLTARSLVIAVLFVVVASAGCKTSNPSGGSQSASALPHSTATDARGKGAMAGTVATQPIASDATPAPGTAQALAQRANTYAQSVTPLLSHHSTPQESQSPVGGPMPKASPALHPPAASEAGAKTENTDPRAFATVPNQPDVQVVPPIPTPLPAPTQIPATDARTSAFARRAAEYPQDLSAQTDYQLLKLLEEETVPDLQSMSGLTPEDRDLLSSLMDSLANFRNQLRQNNNMLLSKKISPLVDLGERLKGQAELAVPTFIFVSQAPGFGRYQAVEPRFVAGKPHMVGIYYEVENFKSDPNENGLYETRLTENLVLYMESSGMPVWQDRKSTLTDTSHRRRRDFFNAKNITLPASLTIGRYLLKVTIEDQQGPRIAESTIPVEIVAQ